MPLLCTQNLIKPSYLSSTTIHLYPTQCYVRIKIWKIPKSFIKIVTKQARFRIPVDKVAGWAAWSPWPRPRCPSAARCPTAIEKWRKRGLTWSAAWRISGTCCCPSTFCSRSCRAWKRGGLMAGCRRWSGWRRWSWSRGRPLSCCTGSWRDLWKNKCASHVWESQMKDDRKLDN